MKYLIAVLFCFFAFFSSAQKTDSVAVRVYNEGRFYIKNYTVTINNSRYTFTNIWKHKYSAYQNLPYIFSLNGTDVTAVRKRFMRYDEWMYVTEYPIDDIGEKEITNGKVTIFVKTRKRSGNLIVKSNVVQE